MGPEYGESRVVSTCSASVHGEGRNGHHGNFSTRTSSLGGNHAFDYSINHRMAPSNNGQSSSCACDKCVYKGRDHGLREIWSSYLDGQGGIPNQSRPSHSQIQLDSHCYPSTFMQNGGVYSQAFGQQHPNMSHIVPTNQNGTFGPHSDLGQCPGMTGRHGGFSSTAPLYRASYPQSLEVNRNQHPSKSHPSGIGRASTKERLSCDLTDASRSCRSSGDHQHSGGQHPSGSFQLPQKAVDEFLPNREKVRLRLFARVICLRGSVNIKNLTVARKVIEEVFRLTFREDEGIYFDEARKLSEILPDGGGHYRVPFSLYGNDVLERSWRLLKMPKVDLEMDNAGSTVRVTSIQIHHREWFCLNPNCPKPGILVDGRCVGYYFNPGSKIAACHGKDCSGRQVRSYEDVKSECRKFGRL